MRRQTSLLLPAILAAGLMVAGPGATDAIAVEVTLAPTLCGHDEREEGAGACPQEADFKAGVSGADLHLKIGGEAWGCDSEWATSLEFDLGGLPMGAEVYIATLVVRKTGYSDDSEGFTYLGAYAYDATGSEVLLARDDLTPETALDIAYPSAANTDLSFDVTAAVQAWLNAGTAKAGLLLAPVYSEIGYEDWISVGGCGYALPPRLVIVHEGDVVDESTSWSDLKANYR
ncbi:MAG: hypothetical protein IPG61_06495 [bacterium]|nr:hypothetical protein [bacterium]